jgi:pyrroloquinoline quinone (PQQ) biosynthesis protein C
MATTQRTFHEHIRRQEVARNAGVTTKWHESTGLTEWLIAGETVGISHGKIGESTKYVIV